MSTVLAVVATLSLGAFGSNGFGSTKAHAAPPSFDCKVPTIFVAQGTTATQLSAAYYTPSGAQFSSIGSPWAGTSGTRLYNAIAFNPTDRYLYAISDFTGTGYHALRIGSDGTVEELGVLAGMPTNGRFINNGTIVNGNYYVMSKDTNELFTVNLSTLTATMTTLSDTWFVSDFTPVGGYLWGRDGGLTERLDPVSGIVTRFTDNIVPPADSAGGATFTFGNGNWGISSSQTGVVSQIRITNPTSTTPGFELISQSPGPQSERNDGASCLPDPFTTDLVVAKSGPSEVTPGGNITWALTVTNNGPAISSASPSRTPSPLG